MIAALTSTLHALAASLGMSPRDLGELAAWGTRRFVVVGPHGTSQGVLALAAVAHRLREYGHEVLAPSDMRAVRAECADLGTVAVYRRGAEWMLEGTDAVFLCGDWENDPVSVSSQIIAESLGVPAVDWAFVAPLFETAPAAAA